ncbi:MAG: FAD-dependent oxidoreductase [Eggerthellaceae bacterium]|nr:FAD-dependent oxidoreductase [Eggerthellaceae bacterium]
MLDTVFSPYSIGNCEIKNRLVVPAMVTNYCTIEGRVTDRYLKYHEEKAKGGWGLIITEDYSVQQFGKGYQRIPGAYKDELIEGNRELTSAVHAYGAKIFCQIYHPGRQATLVANENHDVVAPTPIIDPLCMTYPRTITVEEIKQVVADFGQAARRVKEMGFDGIELHCAHGYLLAEFLSPFVNKRVDEYGGCFENRVRIVKEIYEAMRTEVGSEFPIIVRFSGIEYVPGGRTEAESYELALYFEELGFDGLHVSNGAYASAPPNQIIAPMHAPHALNMEVSSQIKSLVNIPVIVTNRINDPRMAETLLRMGKADFIGMGRGSLCDPHLPNKARAGELDTIRYCLGCLQGCEMPLFFNQEVTCVANPGIGLEYKDSFDKVDTPKKVMVVGAGPAGLFAAETAAKRGHIVTVYEAQEDIGGQYRSAAYSVGKGELATLASSLRTSLNNLGVPIYLNCEVTEDLIREASPDTVVLATGAKPNTPDIPGLDRDNVAIAEDVLLGRVDYSVEGPVVVLGGGKVACETATHVAQINHDVTVVARRPVLLTDMDPVNAICQRGYMDSFGVKTRPGCPPKAVTGEGVVFLNEAGEEEVLPAALVISALGYIPYNPLEEVARMLCDEVLVIGSAVEEGDVMSATKDGYEAGLQI